MGKKFWFGIVCAVLLTAIVVSDGLADEPVFVKWLLMDDPGDRAIASHWGRFETGDLDVDGMIDLGTMLFYRGYPKDAIRVFEAALDVDGDLAEAWFRIGLVEHHRGELREARRAYTKCLNRFKGHGWCNFYRGLLEEQSGNAVTAMKYYQKAFRYAPVLSDPTVNPEMTSSGIAFGARLKMMKQQAFSNNLPLAFMDPDEVRAARKSASGAAVDTEAPAPDDSRGQTAPQPVPIAEAPTETQAAPAGGGAAIVATPSGRARGSRSKGESEPKPLQAKPTPTKPEPSKGTSDLPYGLPDVPSASSEANLRAWWNETRDAFV